MQGKHLLVTFFGGILFAAVVPGCMISGGGSIVAIEEPGKEARAEVVLRFNEATALLPAAEVDEAIAAYKEVERLGPDNPATQKQLGLIYEFFKQDEETAYRYYKKYKALGGTEPAILEAVKELGRKYGR